MCLTAKDRATMQNVGSNNNGYNGNDKDNNDGNNGGSDEDNGGDSG
jgi:hypothetical protein